MGAGERNVQNSVGQRELVLEAAINWFKFVSQIYPMKKFSRTLGKNTDFQILLAV